MSSFPSPLSSPQLTTLRASGYWARVLACLNPPEVVFRALAAESITDEPFIEFEYDNVDVGAYTDVWEGMVVYISATDSIRDAKYRGRVRLAPTSNTFSIDYNDTILNDGDYVIVARDTDLFARHRNDTLVDDSVAYHDLPPMLAGLPSAIVLYDSDNDGLVTYTPAVTGIPVDADATTVDIWAWAVSGAGSSSIDDATLQAPEITLEAGYHYLLRVVYQDDNGEINYQISHVYAVTRTLNAPSVISILVGSISHDIDDGSSTTLTAYAEVTTLIDRTHVAVFALEHFGDDSSTTMVNNVWMNGRIRSSTIQTEGSVEAGRTQQVTFSVEGITAYLRRLNIPNDIVRATVSPNEWGEITAPNPYRMAVYALWVYTTLTNICSLSVEEGAFEAYQIGGEPRGIDGGKILDVLNAILAPVSAAPNFAPSGEIYLARTVSYLEDRSSVDTVATFALQDMTDLSIEDDSSRTTSQVIGYGGVFDSGANTFVLYQAHAPTIVAGEGDTRELTREILTVDSTVAEAQDELEARVSNDYAFNNSKPLMRLSLFDSWGGVLIPTNYQRWAAIIPASANPLAQAYSADDFWQLQGVTLGINADGTVDTSGEWYAETSFSGAQTDAALLPDNLSNMNPNLPGLPNDPFAPTDLLENYPTDTPGLDELAPIDPDSAAQAYTPWPPDVAAAVAAKAGTANCNVLQLLFSNPSNTESSWLTVNTAPYLITAEGRTETISGTTVCFNLKVSASEWYPSDFAGNPDPTNVRGTYHVGEGLGPGTASIGGKDFYWSHPPMTGAASSITFTFNEAVTNFGFGTSLAGAGYNGPVTNTITFDTTTDPASFPLALNDRSVMTFAGNVAPSTTLRVESICFVMTTSVTPVNVDAFYQWNEDDEGKVIDSSVAALGPFEGLFIDNSLFTPLDGIPPFNASHRYANLRWTGTGNTLLARMVFSAFTSSQRKYLTLDVCRQG